MFRLLRYFTFNAKEFLFIFPGKLLFIGRSKLCKRYSSHTVQANIKLIEAKYLWKRLQGRLTYPSQSVSRHVCCSNQGDKDEGAPSKTELIDARIIYSVAPALGHNQVNINCYFFNFRQKVTVIILIMLATMKTRTWWYKYLLLSTFSRFIQI